MKKINDNILRNFFLLFFLFLVFFSGLNFSGCRAYDNRFDLSYFFKTEPEKAAIDFLYALQNHDPEYIYNNLLLDRDKRSISKEKFTREMYDITSRIKSIEINSVIYLGLESDMGKVVMEFDVEYINGYTSNYKKYIYLQDENGRWKIVFDKTFI